MLTGNLQGTGPRAVGNEIFYPKSDETMKACPSVIIIQQEIYLAILKMNKQEVQKGGEDQECLQGRVAM